jgi:hypothetical protein
MDKTVITFADTVKVKPTKTETELDIDLPTATFVSDTRTVYLSETGEYHFD